MYSAGIKDKICNKNENSLFTIKTKHIGIGNLHM